jgi:hypothetical protein
MTDLTVDGQERERSGGLYGFLDRAGTDAAGADIRVSDRTFEDDFLAAEVGTENPIGSAV